MTEATQRPWYATHDGTTYYHIQSAAINEDNYVARVDAMDSQGDANVDLILKAVNSHDALVAALDNFVTWIDSPDLEWGGVPETPELVALRAALEQVK